MSLRALLSLGLSFFVGQSLVASDGRVHLVLETSFNVGQSLGQVRSAVVDLGDRQGILVVYAADHGVDPYHEMFFYPEDSLKIAVYDLEGNELWTRDLGMGIPPGAWFCPVFPFDFNGDGVDEIFYIGNPDESHPLAIKKYRLECVDGTTGETLGMWPWPRPIDKSPSHMFRNFIFGGEVRGEPVLVTAQGTYLGMKLQAWNPGMELRWEHVIQPDSPGARGSHMCPIVDFDGDGIEEVLWGERLIELDKGVELFCADKDNYRGHSDIIQPFLNRKTGKWMFFTCREKDEKVSPRIVTFDHEGNRVWGDLEFGHIDTGWVARLGGSDNPTALGVRIGSKTAGPDGLERRGTELFTYDAVTGARVSMGVDVYGTIPVDVNGDGVHELVYALDSTSHDLISPDGTVHGNVGGTVSMVGHFDGFPGEQIVSFLEDGTIKIWRDRNAVDSEVAEARYRSRFYQVNQKITAVGHNLINLAGR